MKRTSDEVPRAGRTREPIGLRSGTMIIGRTAPPDLLTGALAHTLAAVARVTADDHDRPSPCAGWTVDDVLRHLLDSFDCLSAALNFGRVDLDQPAGERRPGGVTSVLIQSARALGRASRRRPTTAPVAVGELPLAREKVIIVGAVEAAVHGWDISAGTGRPLPIPDPLAAELLRRLPELGGAGPGVFGPPLALPDARTSSQRLLADLGRDWRFAGR
jgi:uncharacterized protein (TIGR03086 family)